jgi:hypothetical protein
VEPLRDLLDGTINNLFGLRSGLGDLAAIQHGPAICGECQTDKGATKAEARAQTNELRSTDPRRSIPNMGRNDIDKSTGTVSGNVTMIRILAANNRNMPFIHFIRSSFTTVLSPRNSGESS